MENQEKTTNATSPTPSLNTQIPKSDNRVASVIIVILVAIIGFLLLRDSTPPTKESPATVDEKVSTTTGLEKIRSVSSDEHILGNPNAKVFVVEYSDTECPFCKMFHNTMHEVINERGNDVAWVYRHFPIEQLHQKAFRESLAMECAWEQGGNDIFWQYTDQIYLRTNSNDSLPDEELFNIANEFGLDMEQFTSCLETEKYASKVEADMLDGRLGGVEGTPTSFIVVNNEVVNSFPGASPKELVIREVERALR